jgi:KDO2-lipid IV(A) lauroyltransferase
VVGYYTAALKKAAIIQKRPTDGEWRATAGVAPDPMKSLLIRSFLRLLSCLPLGLARRLGAWIGSLAWRSGGRMQQTTATNLALCYPAMDAAQRSELGRRSLQASLQTIMEAGMAWHWPAPRVLALIHTVDGLPLVQQAKAAGKGVLLLSPHLGNWEVLGLYVNACGLGQSYQLYQAPADPGLDRLLFRARSRTGARMVATDTKGVAELLRALRAGDIAGILPDQIPDPSGGDYAPFFGVPAFTMSLVSRLQQKTGATVLLAVARRAGAGFEIVFRAPEPEIYAKDIPVSLAAMNRSIEAIIGETPEQYTWEYKRFRRQPDGTNPY